MKPINLHPTDTLPISARQILDIGFSFSRAKVLLTAVELDVFTSLSQSGKTAAELSAELGLRSHRSADFFDALVALGFLHRFDDGATGIYQNTAQSAQYLDRNSDAFIGGLLNHWNKSAYQHWDGLAQTLKSGRPRQPVEEELPEFEAQFARRMRHEQLVGANRYLKRSVFESFSRKFDFSAYQTVCDIGSEAALLPRVLAGAYPHLQCTSLDFPQAAESAMDAIDADGLGERVRVMSGNFFAAGFVPAQVITIGMLLRDWHAEVKMHLLRLAYQALPQDGVLVVIEQMLDTRGDAILSALQSLLETGDANDYRSTDFIRWCREAGFRYCEILPLDGTYCAALAYK